MGDHIELVNKLLEGVDDNVDAPEPYLDWLGQKVDTGPLKDIRFGAYIYLSDEETIRENATERGVDVERPGFWDEVERCMAIMESNCLQVLRESGLHVSDEGHDENARVASVWIDTEEEDRRLALLKAVINWSEGDWPSTTSGTMDYAFGANTTQKIYQTTEDAAQFIDVAIEFSGTDALVEWSRLNLNEAIRGNPDDPDVFLRHYVPRMQGRLMIEFNAIKPHFPDAPANWYRENVDATLMFRYNKPDYMRSLMQHAYTYNRTREDRAGIEQVTYRFRFENPQGHSLCRRFLDEAGCSPATLQWVCETNAPIWFYVSVREFNAYMQMVYPQVKLKEALGQVTYEETDADELEKTGVVFHFGDNAWGDCARHGDPYLIKLDGKPVGWFQLTDQNELNAIEILPEYQQQGIGTEIVRQLYGDQPDPSALTSTPASKAGAKLLKRFGIDAEVYEADEEADPKAYLDAVTGRRRMTGEAVEPEPEPNPDNPEQYLQNIYDWETIREKLENYGLSFYPNEFQPWGRWVVIKGFAYWAVYSKDPEKYLPQSFFREQLEKFCKDMGFTVYKIQTFNEPPVPVGFKLAIPKTQVDVSSWEHAQRMLDDPDFRERRQVHDLINRDWLPESVEADDVDDPKADALRLMANAPMRYNELRQWTPYIHVPRGSWANPEDYYFTVFIVPVFTNTGRLSKANSYRGLLRMKQFTNKNPPTWEQRVAAVNAVVPDQLPGFYASKLKKQGYQVGMAWEPYEGKFYDNIVEALNPDDPDVNIDRHMASMDIDAIMQRLGFSERKPTWNCADPEYRWFEKFVRGLKWTVIRASDDTPQIFDVAVYRPGKTQTPNGPLTDYNQIGALKCHVGELEARLATALKGRVQEDGVPLPPEDDPANALEQHAQRVEQGEKDALDSIINMAVEDFETRVRLQGVVNWKRADQLAAEIGDQWAATGNYANGSDEYDWVVSAVNNRASEMFPSAPVEEAVDDPSPESYINKLPIPVKATISGERDGVRQEQEFDAAPYFEYLAQEGDIESMLDLAKCDFHSDYPADRVGQFFSDDVLEDFFRDNLESGFEVYVDFDDIRRWVEHNKPEWYAMLWPGDMPIKEAADPDDPSAFIRHMETDWRKILRQYGWKPQPHTEHLSFTLEFPDRVWGANWPMRIHAGHGWGPEPEFDYIHPDPDNPDIDAEDEAYEVWLRDHPLGRRDINFPDYIYFQFGREHYLRIEVPLAKLASFCSRLVQAAKGIVGTETIASVHQGRGLDTMLWEAAQKIARELGVPVNESIDDPDEVDPMAYAASTFSAPELLRRLKFETNRDGWSRVFHREPALRDLMILVTRRGMGQEIDDSDTLYDAVLYAGHGKEWKPFLNRWGRRAIQLEPMLKKLEARIKANNLGNTVDESEDPAVPVPPEDEPTDVIKQHEKGLLLPEMERLGFTFRRERGVETIYGDEIPRWWYKTYDAPDQSRHALNIYFWGGQTPEAQANVYDGQNNQWFKHGEDHSPKAPAQNQAHLSAIVRDLDAAMQRNAPLNLPPPQEFEAIKRVIAHHSQWWEDTLDYLVNQGGIRGQIGPGQPA